MNLNPKVSIIIPVYNGSNYLSQAIESALKQTYKNIEIIVINDGSQDNRKTEEIAKSYDDKIRYFYKENGGVSSALNYGIKKMKGEWFSWLSHDDLYLPKKIETQINYWRNKNDIKIMAAGAYIINEKGEDAGEISTSSIKTIKKGYDFFKPPLNGCTMLIHKECFNKAGLFNTNNKTTQDVEEWIKILYYYPIYFIKQPLIKFRIHKEAGSILLKGTHTKDLFYFFKNLLEDYDISWFFPDNTEENNINKIKTYQWLGYQALIRGSIDGAFLCHKYAHNIDPTTKNLSFYINKAGKNIFQYIGTLYIKQLRIKKYIYQFIRKNLSLLLKFYSIFKNRSNIL